MIGKLAPNGLVAMKDSKREGFVKDNEVPISIKLFRGLLLNILREIFKDCEVITMIVYLTAGGESRDNWVIRLTRCS